MFGCAEAWLSCALIVQTLAAGTTPDPFLALPPGNVPDDNTAPVRATLGQRKLSLRHVYHHGAHRYPDLLKYHDVPAAASIAAEEYDTEAVSYSIQRLLDRRKSTIDGLLLHAERQGFAKSLPIESWTEENLAGPNTTDKETVISLAWMAANAYAPKVGKGDWHDVGNGFNYSESFGWEMDGLRGHIFTDEANSTVVIGLKGTSMAVFDGAETTGHDKTNDNLFASCCAGQGGPFFWKVVGDCMSSSDAYTCNSTCVVKELRKKDRYYTAARHLYHNVTERYPAAQVWLTGHSLGGVVSSLLGLTYGVPVVTFEAYPDALAASRLGLPVPPGYKVGSHNARTDLGIYHFGHTADPVYMGACNSAFALCTLGGYAMESLCHTGMTCEYDTVEDLGWRSDVSTHRILTVIPDVLERYNKTAECRPNPDCTDCYKWKFFKSNGTETTTTSRPHSSTSTRTRTRTETCKTPGWWGCLDEPTTTSHPSTRTTTFTTTTSTCKTPGWFGCLDPVTSTYTITTTTPQPVPSQTSSAPTSTSTSTCETPGWFGFGCEDETTSTIKSSHSTLPTHTTCTSREWFGLICVDPSPTATPSTTPTTASRTGTTATATKTTDIEGRICIDWHWWGACREWMSRPRQDLR